MESPEQEEVKVSSTTVRRLRAEHGWSQEQLATVSGLSLRTIQRVEAEGSASLETRTSLAAAFAVQLAELAEAPVTREQAHESVPAPSFTLYKVAAIIAAIACVPAVLALVGVFPVSLAWLGAASIMVVIAFALYAMIGWYMAGAKVQRSRLRRMVQALFIFGGIFCALALASGRGGATLVSAALAGLLAVIIYFVVDYFASRHRNLGDPAR